jgi:hypothetical protein
MLRRCFAVVGVSDSPLANRRMGRPSTRRYAPIVLVFGVALLCAGSRAPQASAFPNHVPYQMGDVFVAGSTPTPPTGTQTISHYNSSGVLVDSFTGTDEPNPGVLGEGLCFDPSGNLYLPAQHGVRPPVIWSIRCVALSGCEAS